MTDAQRETELLPCPFCGGEAEIIRCSVHCNNPACEAQPFTAGQSEAEAIAAWNRRASPDDLLLQAAEALECNAMWAEGSEAHSRLLNIAAALRQRIGRGK
jgi:hypothetical protein